MGLLKNLLPAIGLALALFGVGLVVQPEDTVRTVLGGKVLKGSMFAWSALGSFKFGFGMLAIFSRNCGERFKIGIVSVILFGTVVRSLHAHAESSGLPAFDLAHPPYVAIVGCFVLLVIAVVLNKLEPGFLEEDKSAPRRSARNRTKRA